MPSITMRAAILPLSILLAFACGTAQAQIGKRFPSERKVVKDPVTGTMLTFLTSKPHGDSKIYPTHPQWTADGKWVVFRSRLAGGEALAVNEESGDIVQVTEGGYTGMLNLARKANKLYFMRKDAEAKRQQIVEVDLDTLFADSKAGKLKGADAYQRVTGITPAAIEAGGDMALDADEEWVYFRTGREEAARHMAPGARIEPAFGPRNMGAGPAGIARMNIRTADIRHVISVPFQVGHIQANLWKPGEIVFCWATRAKVPAELHVFEQGGHGVGMTEGLGTTSAWPQRAGEWLRMRGLLGK